MSELMWAGTVHRGHEALLYDFRQLRCHVEWEGQLHNGAGAGVKREWQKIRTKAQGEIKDEAPFSTPGDQEDVMAVTEIMHKPESCRFGAERS